MKVHVLSLDVVTAFTLEHCTPIKQIELFLLLEQINGANERENYFYYLSKEMVRMRETYCEGLVLCCIIT